MTEIAIPPYGSARIWIDEHPTLAFEPDRVITSTVDAELRIRSRRRAGIEWFQPIGPFAMYALICGDFEPNDLGRSTLRVPVSDNAGELLSWSLAARSDEVRAGLPEEYAKAILDTAPSAAALLGSGILTLTPAAHGSVGSNRNIFSKATMALLEIMAMNAEDITNESLSQIIQKWRTNAR